MAPIIAQLVASGLSLLGKAVLAKGKEVVEEKLGVKLPNGDQPLSPELVATLKVKEMEHEEWLVDAALRQSEINLRSRQLDYDDTKSARQMQMEALRQDDVFSKRFVYYLAAFWSATSIIYIFVITLVNIPKDSIRFVDTILGFLLGTVVATLLTYFFGSSRQSHQKDDTIQDLIKGVRDASGS